MHVGRSVFEVVCACTTCMCCVVTQNVCRDCSCVCRNVVCGGLCAIQNVCMEIGLEGWAVV